MSMHFHVTKALTVLTALAATATLVPSTASAQNRPVFVYGEPGMVRTELISFARLDLTKARDQKRLQHKVGAAVERVCLREIGRDGLQDRSYDACASTAWGAAAPQIAEAVSKASGLASNDGGPIAVAAIRVSAR